VSRRRAFSLAEIAIALGILAVIAGAAIKTGHVVGQAERMARTTRDLQEIAEALRRHRADTGAWPSQLGVLAGTYLPAGTVLQTAWGDAIGYATSGAGVVLSAELPNDLAPANGLGGLETTTDLGNGRRRLTVFVARPAAAADLIYERNRVTGGTGD
jgi:prepilin-type N-terminal cleavage/methylation domain-containing protein